MRYAAFGSGTPLDELAKAARGLEFSPLRTGPSLSRNGDVLHPEGLEFGLDFASP